MRTANDRRRDGTAHTQTPRWARRTWLCLVVAGVLGATGSVAGGCAAKKPKVRVVTLIFAPRESTNEGRPMTVVIQESGKFAGGPPTYDEVVRAAGEGKNLLGRIVVYPGHENALRLTGLPVGASILISALYTSPSEGWQRQINLGSREQVTIRFDMKGILP